VLASKAEFKPGAMIAEISVDLAEYEKYKVMNAVPLWNIKRVMAQDKAFPMPAIDRVNFDHVIALDEFGAQNGYIVATEDTDYIYSKRLEHDLVIISPYDNQHQWELLQIENVSNDTRGAYPFDLMSNRRDLGFIGRYSSLKSVVVRTKGELARILSTYEISGALLFQDVEILTEYKKEPETADCNSFIDDNIRLSLIKKFMLVKFKPVHREDYLLRDKMSFLVSELQILFPEYRCVGELV